MVSENNSFEDVTNLFYDRIKDQVTSVTLDSSDTINLVFVSHAWPEETKYEKSDFPVIVVENDDADDDEEEVQYDLEQVRNRLNIAVAATSTQVMNKLLGACYNAIKTYKNEFREQGITRIKLTDKDNEPDEFGAIKVRKGILTFEVTWRRNRW